MTSRSADPTVLNSHDIVTGVHAPQLDPFFLKWPEGVNSKEAMPTASGAT